MPVRLATLVSTRCPIGALAYRRVGGAEKGLQRIIFSMKKSEGVDGDKVRMIEIAVAVRLLLKGRANVFIDRDFLNGKVPDADRPAGSWPISAWKGTNDDPTTVLLINEVRLSIAVSSGGSAFTHCKRARFILLIEIGAAGIPCGLIEEVSRRRCVVERSQRLVQSRVRRDVVLGASRCEHGFEVEAVALSTFDQKVRRVRCVGKLGFDREDLMAARQDKFVNKEFEKRAPMLVVYAGTKASRERIAMRRR